MTVERFRPEHVAGFADVDQARRFAEVSPQAYTVRHDGEILVCGGVAELEGGRGLLWSFVTEAGRRAPHRLHRAARRFLSTLAYRRLEATCRGVRACRWLEALGFQHEGTLRSWTSDGADFEMYARIR